MAQLIRIAVAFLCIALLLPNVPGYGQSGGEPDSQGRVIVDFMGTPLLTGNEYNRIIGNAVDSLSSQGGHPVLKDWVDSVEMFLDNACFSGTKDSIVFYMLSHEAGMAGQDWQRAYHSLNRLEHITDSIRFEELHRQVYSLGNALHKAEEEDKEQNPHLGLVVAIVILSAAVLALTAATFTLYSKLRKQRKITSLHAYISRDIEEESVRQKDEIRELEGGMKRMKERQRQEERARKALAVMLQQRAEGSEELIAFTEDLLKVTGELANIYYESSSRPETLAGRVKKTLGDRLDRNVAFRRIGQLVEASYPGFMQDLTGEFPWLNDDDRLLISLMICGISSGASCVILNIGLNSLNIRKTRIAKKMNAQDRLSIYLRDRLYNWNQK